MKTLLAVLAFAVPTFAADVSGYVFAMDGSVVHGATVRAGAAATTTNEDGAFAFANLAEGVVELEIEAEGFPAARPLVLTGEVVTVTLTQIEQRPLPHADARGEGIVTGRVTVDGKPLANAPVLVGDARVVTNAKGEYVAKGLAPARHVVAIDERLSPRLRSPHAGRMYPEGREPHVADLRKTREASVNLDLRAAPMIRGRVVDADRKPVARARVQLVFANRSSLDFAFDPSATRSAPDGRFAFPAPDWTDDDPVNVAVTPLLHSTFRSKPFALGSASHEIDITLPKVETVRIRVLDRSGKPIPEARVAFASSADTRTFESVERLVEHGFVQRAAKTNADGELMVQLAADSYDFAASAEGFQTGTLTSKTITKPMRVDLTLERAAILRGRVHRGDRGVANVNVNIVGGRPRGATSHGTTDAEGAFEIGGLAPGTYRVAFFKQEELIDRTMDVDAPGTVDLALPPTGTLRGRVLDSATGMPVREFAFSVEPVDADPRVRHIGGVHRGESTEDGRFTLEIPAGSYRVSAGSAGYTSSEPAEVRVVEHETTTIDLPLGRGAIISGRVTDESGLPVAGADVMVMAADFERMRMRRAARVGPAQAKTADDGTFTVTGIEPGEAQLTVRQQGYVLHRRTIEAEGNMSVDVQLARGLSIRGIVTRGGKPVEGAQVGASTAAIGGEHQSAVTDDDGRFTLSGLVAGRYTVSAYLEEQHTEVRDVDPSRRKEILLSLDPKPRGVIYGTVTGIPPTLGGKFVRRTVMVHSEDFGAEGTIDDAGNYRIEDAPIGNVSVTAHVETASRAALTSARKQAEVIAGQPLRVDLELSGSVHVSGRITLEGRPVAGAFIGFSSADGMAAYTQARDDGSYEVTLVAPGRYHVYARAEQLSERHFQTVREIRGGETIDIDLREQVIEGTVVDAVTRQPIAGALVTLAPAAGAVQSIAGEVPTDANGRFRIVTAASGSYRLIASAHGYAHRMMQVGGASMVYAFELTPAPDLRLRILDARTGTPLDAHIVVADESGVLPSRPRRTTDGATYVFSLAPGRYRVLAIVQGYTAKEIEVTAPGALDIAME
ncbi:MAG: carboxypeptidase regulatory-like domain-containing protein [Thermoanaerobaculia bacterium]